MVKLNKIRSSCLLAFCLLFLVTIANAKMRQEKIIIRKSTKHDVSLPFSLMQGKSLLNRYPDSKSFKSILEKILTQELVSNSLIPLNGFQGMGVGLGNYQVHFVNPDTSGNPGTTQYFQFVNSDISIFDKKTGQIAVGFPKRANSLWTGFGGPCEDNDATNMIVKFDQLANRWVVSQFTSADPHLGPYYHCIAISTTDDATGTYYRYAFQHDSLSDSISLALWSDAYYVAFNMLGRVSFGPQVCGLDRSKMLMGQDARIICQQLSSMQTGPLSVSDLVGKSMPPRDNPVYYISLGETNTLNIYKYHVDFDNPINTQLSNISIPVDAFVEACGGSNGMNCTVQPNTTTRLDMVSDRIMTQLTYRQFPDYGMIVATHTIDGPQPKYAPEIRWYELRVLNNISTFNPIIHQQATLAPDSKNRFIGSAGTDKMGNVAIGYNVTSSLIYPSLEMGYRLVTDPLNTLTIQPLVTGFGNQSGLSNWGRTNNLSVDPVDECTFWFSGEYMKTSGILNWSTYIVNFKMPNCN